MIASASTPPDAAAHPDAPVIPSRAAAEAPILAPAALVAAQARRYSAKKFDPSREIPDPVWSALERALVYSPSSSGLQPWRFVILSDRARRETLVPLSFNQRQVADSSHLVIFQAKEKLDHAHLDRWVRRLGEVRGLPWERQASQKERLAKQLIEAPQPGFDPLEFAKRQVYIALGNFLSAAALLGIDTCPMEGFQPEAYDKELGLEGSGFRSVVLAAAGYGAADDANAHAPKTRFPQEDVILRL
jgi:nitroreductase